ncbi:MAG TPA: HAMP domain-containing sensor histidine kinase, partial [Ramlibacter sp.]|nr:HAMP domain-containing sensor histidine kinase [Ramlibacter sp.]
LALEHGLSAGDLQNYTDDDARKRFDQSFSALKKLPDAARIKVFNRNNTVVWSDDPSLVGVKRSAQLGRLELAMAGQVQAVFNTVKNEASLDGQGSSNGPMIECYVPILMHDAAKPEPAVIGVLSLYRNPADLNRTIRQGLYLVWTIIGGAGLVLFVALYTLFKLVYSRQKTAELKFSKLTVEHERIVQIEKMSAMGELVANIAHQLNNPLVGVINLTQLAERQVEHPQRVSELLAEVRKAGAECRDIVHRILRISQISRSTLQPTDIKELVQDTITFCHQSIDRNQALDFAAPEQKVMLDVDPVLIRQALFNLIHNAILAAPGKAVQVALSEARHEGIPGVLLSVADAGAGFSSETAARLFKPFFTTRSSGTGLGLSVAQHIAMKHGGVVLAENLPAGGARFSIWLPTTSTA